VRRRDFITLLGGAATAWPLAARAQQSGRVRRVGVLMGLTQSDPEGQSRIAAFRKTLQGLGWTEGRDLRTDYYWAAGDIDRTHALAKELVSSAPDVIVVNTPPGLSALRLETHTIPIIFVQVLDASESTVVMNPARPESNVTGFTNSYEYGVSGKWLALLKEIAPSVSRVAILQNPNHPSWVGYQGSIAKTAPLLGLQPIPARVRRRESSWSSTSGLPRRWARNDWSSELIHGLGTGDRAMTTRPLSALTMLLSRHTKRRTFISFLGSAVAWPFAARAQQAGKLLTIGFLGSSTLSEASLCRTTARTRLDRRS